MQIYGKMRLDKVYFLFHIFDLMKKSAIYVGLGIFALAKLLGKAKGLERFAERVELSLKSVKAKSIFPFDYLEVIVKIEVYNPEPEGIQLNGVSGIVTAQGKQIATTRTSPIWIKQGISFIDVIANISVEDFINIVNLKIDRTNLKSVVGSIKEIPLGVDLKINTSVAIIPFQKTFKIKDYL